MKMVFRVVPMIPFTNEVQGTSKLHRVTRYKFVRLRMKWIYDKSTKIPSSLFLVTTLVLLLWADGLHTRKRDPCLSRNDPRHRKMDDTYKIRTVVERDINHIKDNLCLAGRRTQMRGGPCTLIFLPGSHTTYYFVLADKINHHEENARWVSCAKFTTGSVAPS